MLYSTRTNESVKPSEAIVRGIANGGGLFMPNYFNDKFFNKELLSLDYKALAKKVLCEFFDDFSKEEIDEVIEKAYSKDNFDISCDITTFNKDSYLELWHGPTLAFKDMALTVLPNLLFKAKKHLGDNKKTVILTATSGDTGSATLSGFANSPIDAFVLYPHNGVSQIQEAQMLYYARGGSKAIAVENNFDFCQTLVKKVFTDNFKYSVELSSANSINIGRLIPQVVYYIYSYISLVNSGKIKFGEEIVFSVPTGNFGDILAGFIAKKLGTPIKEFICASNSNDVLTEFFATGKYNRKRPFKKTISPSMDILVSSNLERLLYVLSDNDYELVNKLMQDLSKSGEYVVEGKIKEGIKEFIPEMLDDDGTKQEIGRVYKEHKYLIDPHTAVASGAVQNYRKESGFKGQVVIVSTASPFKFASPVSEAIGLTHGDNLFDTVSLIEQSTGVKAPKIIGELKNFTFDRTVWTSEDAESALKDLILKSGGDR